MPQSDEFPPTPFSPSNPSYLQQYRTCSLVELCTQDVRDLDDIYGPFHRLDEKIRSEFRAEFEMYEQGLVHSVEFYNRLTIILNRSRP